MSLVSGNTLFQTESEARIRNVTQWALELSPALKAQCYLSGASEQLNNLSKILAFIEDLRTSLGVTAIDVVPYANSTCDVVFYDGAHRRIVGALEIAPRELEGAQATTVRISEATVGSSFFASKILDLMTNHEITDVTFIRDDGDRAEADRSGICINVGPWQLSVRSRFDRVRVRTLKDKFLIEGMTYLRDVLTECKEAVASSLCHKSSWLDLCLATLTKGRRGSSNPNDLTSHVDPNNFDTDENPCEVGFESF